MIEHKAYCNHCPKKINGKGFTETIVWAQKHRDDNNHSVFFAREDIVLLKPKLRRKSGRQV